MAHIYAPLRIGNLINSIILANLWMEKMEDKERTVLEAMRKAGKPVRPGDVAEMISLPKDEVSKIIKGLKKKGKVTSPKRCFWTTTE